MSKTLVFAIYDFDRFSKHDQIGEVKVPLCQIDLAQTIEEWAEVTSVEGEGGQVYFKCLLLDVYFSFYLSPYPFPQIVFHTFRYHQSIPSRHFRPTFQFMFFPFFFDGSRYELTFHLV